MRKAFKSLLIVALVSTTMASSGTLKHRLAQTNAMKGELLA
jgi:hypothetical protein